MVCLWLQPALGVNHVAIDNYLKVEMAAGGAAALAGAGAQRAGAGLIRIASDACNRVVLQNATLVLENCPHEAAQSLRLRARDAVAGCSASSAPLPVDLAGGLVPFIAIAGGRRMSPSGKALGQSSAGSVRISARPPRRTQSSSATSSSGASARAGWAGAVVSGNLDPTDPTAALGFAGAVPDLKSRTTAGGMLYVFSLP